MARMRSDDYLNSGPGKVTTIRAFLTRWQFEVSVSGFLRVQPSGPSLRPEELLDLLHRMRAAYAGEYPAVLTFDFCAVAMSESDRMEIRRLLQELATDIPARMVVTSARFRRLAVAMIRRRGRDTCRIRSTAAETPRKPLRTGERVVAS